MEKPLDGMNLASEVGQRVIDKPELPIVFLDATSNL